MLAKSVARISRYLVVPVVFAGFYALRIVTQGQPIDRWLPKWYTVAIIAGMIVLERIVTNRRAVSQRSVLTRDILSSVVNVYFSAAVTGMLLLPIISPIPEYFLGRNTVVASTEQLGALWFQVPVVLVLVSFFRYWMHRWQHSNAFLWKLHSYHHSVTDLQGTNTYVSHPIDWALRNAVVFILLGLVGFDPQAMLIAVPATTVSGVFSHCGADVKGGVLNYLFVTPEVHRWHHTAAVPEGYGYSVNYGVEFAFWDILFGTFYLPQRDGQTQPPERIGHPGGMADEGNYLKLLLKPLGLWRALPAVVRSRDRHAAD